MTEERASPESRGSGRPSWLHEPCPEWCTRVHRESDHPEDRRHQDDGVAIAAVAGDVDPDTLTIHPRSTELTVRRFLPIGPPHRIWWQIEDSEGRSSRLLLSDESARALLAVLADRIR